MTNDIEILNAIFEQQHLAVCVQVVLLGALVGACIMRSFARIIFLLVALSVSPSAFGQYTFTQELAGSLAIHETASFMFTNTDYDLKILRPWESIDHNGAPSSLVDEWGVHDGPDEHPDTVFGWFLYALHGGIGPGQMPSNGSVKAGFLSYNDAWTGRQEWVWWTNAAWRLPLSSALSVGVVPVYGGGSRPWSSRTYFDWPGNPEDDPNDSNDWPGQVVSETLGATYPMERSLGDRRHVFSDFGMTVQPVVTYARGIAFHDLTYHPGGAGAIRRTGTWDGTNEAVREYYQLPDGATSINEAVSMLYEFGFISNVVEARNVKGKIKIRYGHVLQTNLPPD